MAAITTFDLDLSQLCYDITSVSFCGEYEEAELVRYGYSRDHRPDRKQLELGTTVTVEAGVPIDYRVLAGNVADRTTPVENLARLQHLLSLLPARSPTDDAPLVISDRAMLTLDALVAYRDSHLHCLGPLDPALGQGAVRRLLEVVTVEELAAAPLAYRPARAERDPAWAPYHGVQRSLALPHPDPEQLPLVITALVVWSPGKARYQLAAARYGILRRHPSEPSELRDLIGELRPAGLDEGGLIAALENYAGSLPGGAVHLEVSPEVEELPRSLAICLVRVVREAVRNALHHGRARQVSIRLRPRPASIILRVADNGAGFIVPQPLSAMARANHFGVLGMSERVGQLQGRLRIRSRPGKGTIVTVWLPRSSETDGA